MRSPDAPRKSPPGESGGISIGRSLAIPTGIVHDELRDCGAMLDRIHGVGRLPVIPFSLGQLPPAGVEGLARRGRFTYSREGVAIGITIEIRLSDRGLAALHEIGHFLDLSGIGPAHRWESMIVDGLLRDWRAAIEL